MKKYFLSFILIATLLFCNQVFAQDEMENIALDQGESESGFSLNRERTLSYKGKIIQGIIFDKSVEFITISRPFVNNRYIFCFTLDDNQSKSYLIDSFNFSGRIIIMDGPPMTWLSFSQDSLNVLMASYYEADMKIYIVQLSSCIVQELLIPVDVKKTNDGFPLEEVTYNLDEIRWLDNNMIELTADIKCNPYNDSNCDDLKRQKALRSFKIEFDVENNGIRAINGL